MTGITLNLAPGIGQGNVAILPGDWVADFLKFCWANPKPCPLFAVSEAGDPMLRKLGDDIDIRTDQSMYRVFRDGVMDKDVPDIYDLWQPELTISMRSPNRSKPVQQKPAVHLLNFL